MIIEYLQIQAEPELPDISAFSLFRAVVKVCDLHKLNLFGEPFIERLRPYKNVVSDDKILPEFIL